MSFFITNEYIARYDQAAKDVFFSVNPDGGDTDDPQTQNGYAYVSSNPMMYTDPDANYLFLAINAGFAAYDGYKAYKAGKASGKSGWALAGSVAWASGSSFARIGHLSKATKTIQGIRETTRWVKIKNSHGPNSNKISKGFPNSKFNNNKTLRRTIRATARKASIGKDKHGNDIFEKNFKRPVGINSYGEISKRVRVIKKNGKIVTGFPI